MKRETLVTYGPFRRRVRVLIVPGGQLVRVQWFEHGQARKKSWPNTREGQAEAKAWARGFAEARVLGPLRTSPGPTADMKQSDMERALRRTLRKRGKVDRILSAIHAAAAEAHTTGRLEPYRDGIPPDKSVEVMRRYEAAATRILNL